MESLISADDNWVIWAVLFLAAAFGLWAERTKWGAKVSGAVITILSTFVLSNLGILPASAPAYDVVWSYFVPMAIPLLLFRANIVRIVREAGPTLIAFAIGAVGTIVGTVIAYHLIPLGEEGWKLAAIFCATYVGGSMNYAAAAEAVGLRSGDLLTAGVAADNLVMTAYFLLLFALHSVPFLRKLFPDTRLDDASSSVKQEGDTSKPPTLRSMASALALGAVACAVGYTSAELLGWRGGGIMIVTALVVLLATLFPKKLGSIGGAQEVGTLLMQLFFAVIGASAHIGTVLRVGPVLFGFAAIILAFHLVFLLGIGKLFRLNLAEIVIASNANMGGPTTSAAMAAARRWDKLIIPAILCGTLGYAIATFVGVAVGSWLGP